MLSTNNLLLMLIICVIGITTLAVFAEDPPPVYVGTKESDEGEGINQGIVIAYGKKVKHPYYVKFERDTIWVNDFPYSPRWKDPEKEPLVIVASELTKQKFNLGDSLCKSYRKYADSLGISTAQEMIQTEYGGHPLIKGMTFSDLSETMQLEWADGQVVEAFLYDLGPGITDEERIAQKQRRAVNLGNSLRSGRMIVFSYGSPTYSLNRETSQEIQSVTLDVKTGNITIEEANSNLSEMFRQHHVEQILANLDSWE